MSLARGRIAVAALILGTHYYGAHPTSYSALW